MFMVNSAGVRGNPTLAFIFIAFASLALSAQTPNSAALLSDSFAEVAKKVEPAVVSIDTKGKSPDVSARSGDVPNTSDDLMDMFRRQSRRPVYAVGSGFIVEKSGYILTNAHVVSDAAKITVKLDNGDEYPAKVVGTDSETDIAVLKIETGSDLPVVQLGDSDAARVGEWVLAIGSPFGLARTVTAGIVSQVNRDTPLTSPFQKFIQTDAAINRGNSGGPLVNMKGEVIGVNSQIATSTGDYNGVGFALPTNEANRVFKQIVEFGKVRRGFLGVALESVKPEFAKIYDLKDTRGAIVTEVRDKASAAAMAGLMSGDVITEFDGQPVKSAQDLIAKVAASTPDATVKLVYLREKGNAMERRSADVKLQERRLDRLILAEGDEGAKIAPAVTKGETKPFGLTLTELTPTLAAAYKLDGKKGIIVKDINPDSYIADVKSSNGATSALGPGDLIQRINRVSVTDTKAFEEAVKKLAKGDAVVLHVLTINTQSQSPILKVVQFTVQ